MGIIVRLITLTVSIVLICFLLKLKKNDPFPKFTIPKVIVGGLLSFILSGLITVALMVVYAIIKYGPGEFAAAINELSAGNMNALDNFKTSNPSIFFALFKSIFLIGLVEEVLKFTNMSLVSKKPGTINNRFDVIVLCALAGVGFQIFEDSGVVSSGSIGSALLRALLPLHFTFGVIMGYFYGKYRFTKKSSDLFLAFFIPTIIHGVYDFCVLNANTFSFLIVFAFIAILAGFILNIFMIVRVKKWSKDETLREPLIH